MPFEDRHVISTEGCWEWTAARDRFGYGVYTRTKTELAERGGQRQVYAHRYAWQQVNGPIPAGMFVLHRCDNPPCVNSAHLFLGTLMDNNADRDAKGRGGTTGDRNWQRDPTRVRRGEACPSAKLTAIVVAEIRERYRRGGISQSKLADQYGVKQPQVSRIVLGTSWR